MAALIGEKSAVKSGAGPDKANLAPPLPPQFHQFLAFDL
jgi:hypothetical protein